MIDVTSPIAPGWLIVEDEGLIAMLVEEALEEIGLNVVGRAANISEAMNFLAKTEPQGAILDVNLAGEKVYPLAAELARRNIPFAFLSGQGDLSAVETGANPVIQKPFLPDDIQAAVRGLLATA